MKSKIYQLGRRSYSKKYAITCPGQGLIYTGILRPYEQYRKHFQPILDEADEVLQEKFSEKLFDPSPEFAKKWLINTSNAQPAILTTTFVINKILKQEFNVHLVENATYLLGHSLGEYTAQLLAGVIDYKTALNLVRKRGQLMENLFKSDEYGMVALMFKPTNFETILGKTSDYLANINSHQQVVLSGKLAGIQELVASINSEKKLILRSIQLPVKIPFHSTVLQPIEEELSNILTPVNLKSPITPIIGNLNGKPINDFMQSTIAANSKPVQWVNSMEYLMENGITNIINLGPGDVLQGINSKYKMQNTLIDSIESMKSLQDSL